MARISDIDISLEITPPASPRSTVLLRRASALGSLPHYVNVIHRTDRWSSLDASIALRRSGVAPVWHIANRGRLAHELESEIDRAKIAGLRRVLCVRGEYKARDWLETPKIREVVRMIRRGLPGAHIAVTLNHHQSADRVMRNLLPKLEAGANAVQTQLTFELDTLRRFAEALKADRPDLVITPMLLPVLSLKAALRLSHRLSISIPSELMQGLARHGTEAGWEHFSRLVAAIRDSPLFDGVALMTPMDMDDGFATRLAGAIALPGS
jgi:5,10-methylenetetrahydrofolate reductase